MQYDYAADETPKKRNYPLIVIVAFVAIAIVGIGLNSTGNVTAVCSSFDDCKSKVQISQETLKSCSSDLSAIKAAKEGVDTSLVICQNKLQDAEKYKNAYSELSTDQKELVGNTAKMVCCSSAETDRGATKSFGILNNNIVCGEDSLSLNCRTGSTNYQPPAP